MTELNKILDGRSYPEQFFSEFTLNQKHHLFICLNQSFICTKFICYIINCKEDYGRQTDTERGSRVMLVHHGGSSVSDMSVTEARSLLTVGLLKNVLISNGESVNVYLPVSVFIFAHTNTLKHALYILYIYRSLCTFTHTLTHVPTHTHTLTDSYSHSLTCTHTLLITESLNLRTN